MRRLDAELTRLGKEHDFRDFPEAGHAFMNYTNPEFYREAVAEQAWELTLEFLGGAAWGEGLDQGVDNRRWL